MFITRLIVCVVLLLCVSSAPHGHQLPNLPNGKNCSCLLGQLLLVLSDLVKNQQSPCNHGHLRPADADSDISTTTEGDGNVGDPNSFGLGAQGLYISTTTDSSTDSTTDSTTNPTTDPTTTNVNNLAPAVADSDDGTTTTNSEGQDLTTTSTSDGNESTTTTENSLLSTASTTTDNTKNSESTTENSDTQENPTTINTNAETTTVSNDNQGTTPSFAIADTDLDSQDDGPTTTDPSASFASIHNHDSKCSCGNIDGQFYVPLLRFEGKPDKEAFKFYLNCLFNRKS